MRRLRNRIQISDAGAQALQHKSKGLWSWATWVGIPLLVTSTTYGLVALQASAASCVN